MTFLECKNYIQDNITFRDWTFHVGGEHDKWYLQCQFMSEDNNDWTGFAAEAVNNQLQKCRKWRLSEFMTKTELVRTAFLAVKQGMQHEIEEQFKFKGESIFNSHIDIEEMYEMSKKHRYDIRN